MNIAFDVFNLSSKSAHWKSVLISTEIRIVTDTRNAITGIILSRLLRLKEHIFSRCPHKTRNRDIAILNKYIHLSKFIFKISIPLNLYLYFLCSVCNLLSASLKSPMCRTNTTQICPTVFAMLRRQKRLYCTKKFFDSCRE
jgi:hypothetical protein